MNMNATEQLEIMQREIERLKDRNAKLEEKLDRAYERAMQAENHIKRYEFRMKDTIKQFEREMAEDQRNFRTRF